MAVSQGDSLDGVVVAWSPSVVRPFADVIARRWVLDILLALQEGPLRRTALHRRVRGVSGKVLTDTLRSLESHQLIARSTVASVVPMEVDYRLTGLAYKLWPLLGDIHRWVSENQPSVPGHALANRHPDPGMISSRRGNGLPPGEVEVPHAR
jgi:DNA-binding HxlR family transcriptional regulator